MKTNIGHRILVLAVAICAMWSFAGCRKSDIFSQQASSDVNLELKISTNDFDPAVTRATGAEESRIHSMALLLFKHNGKLHSIHFYPNTSGGTLGVDTNPGKELNLVGVANYTSVEGLEEKLRAITDRHELGSIEIPNTTPAAVRTKGLIQYGEVFVPLVTKNEKEYATLKLDFVHSRVDLDVRLEGWWMDNASFRIHDIVYESISRGVSLTESPMGGGYGHADIDVEWSYEGDRTVRGTAYVCENVSGGRVNKPAPPGLITETQWNGHLFKRHYAPERASRAVIYASYDALQTKELAFYVYFGRNNYDDYNVRRGEKHTYTIVIRGLSGVEIDSNVEVIK